MSDCSWTERTPKIFLHISSLSGEVDQDAGPSAAEAREIAAKLIQSADEVDRWVTGDRK